ncbi:hypothetical protein GALL_203790 [mine drainage metagenome]|uniref:Wadjet protein JetD C-terminal domain-containing protein n=1 Tax=mine drainage metagenome TaxID=410659 RepID=A0A1J5RZX5_9ZZZZ
MDEIARRLLEKLLVAGNRFAAGATSRRPSLTAKQLAPYRTLPTLPRKSACEEALFAARSAGAIEVKRDPGNPEGGFIEKVIFLDATALAGFLGEIPLATQVATAEEMLAAAIPEFPILEQVIAKWRQAMRVRGAGPESAAQWRDAVAVIQFMRSRISEGMTSLPVREASAKLFKDSKRIERIVPQTDVLLSGAVDARPRDAGEVWQEIGLYREPQPALLAGHVEIERERVSALLDAPYAGLPTDAVKGVLSAIDRVLTIENLTTFHSTAKRECSQPGLIVFCPGMPSPSWRAMYRRLLASLPADVPVFHWGDIDEGGFRIASVLAKDALEVGHKLMPMHMHPDDIPEKQRVQASPATVERMQHFAHLAGWDKLARAIGNAKLTTEQEGF